MKKLLFWNVILMSLSFLSMGEGVMASWSPPPLPFDSPSYIDLDYNKLEFPGLGCDLDYTKHKLFRQLVEQFYPEAKSEETSDEIIKRGIKEIKDLCQNNKVMDIEGDISTFEKLLDETFNGSVDSVLKKVLDFMKAVIEDKLDSQKTTKLLKLRIQIANSALSHTASFNDVVDSGEEKQLFQQIEELEKGNQDKTFGYYLTYLKITFLNEDKTKYLQELSDALRKDISSNQTWLREVVAYLIPRFDLIACQKNWDGYSQPIEKHIDLLLLKKAEDGFRIYRETYPKGKYIDSAINIQRRIFYLGDRTEESSKILSKLLSEVLIKNGKGSVLPDTYYQMINEYQGIVDDKPLVGLVDFSNDHPILIAFKVLFGTVGTDSNLVTLLQENKNRFIDFPMLFEYIEAYLLYEMKDYSTLISKTETIEVKNSYLIKSIIALRAKSFAHLNKLEESLKTWKALFKVSPEDTVIIELFGTLYSLNRPWEILSKDFEINTIGSENLKMTFLNVGFETNELKDALRNEKIEAKDQLIIAREILMRYLFSRKYSEFNKLIIYLKETGLALFGEIPFKDIEENMAQLAKFPQDSKAKMEVAKYIQENFDSSFDHDEGDTQLLSMIPKLSKEKVWENEYISPYQTFEEIASQFQNTTKKDELEAEALHHIVLCFKGGANSRECHQTNTIPESVNRNRSKEAFQKIHKKYKNSEWSENTPYYYD